MVVVKNIVASLFEYNTLESLTECKIDEAITVSNHCLRSVTTVYNPRMVNVPIFTVKSKMSQTQGKKTARVKLYPFIINFETNYSSLTITARGATLVVRI